MLNVQPLDVQVRIKEPVLIFILKTECSSNIVCFFEDFKIFWTLAFLCFPLVSEKHYICNEHPVYDYSLEFPQLLYFHLGNLIKIKFRFFYKIQDNFSFLIQIQILN